MVEKAALKVFLRPKGLAGKNVSKMTYFVSTKYVILETFIPANLLA